MVEVGVWAALGWAGRVGAAGWTFAAPDFAAVLWDPFGWAGLAGAVRSLTVWLGLMKGAPGALGEPGLVESGFWATLG